MKRLVSLRFRPYMNVRFGSAAAMLGAVLASVLATGCGDAVVGLARASVEAATMASAEPHFTRSGAPMDGLYSDIRPASVDDRLDPKQPPLLSY